MKSQEEGARAINRLIFPQDYHTCKLPVTDGISYGAVEKCSDCEQWWYLSEEWGSYTTYLVWRPVFWYHWRKRRQIRKKLCTQT